MASSAQYVLTARRSASDGMSIISRWFDPAGALLCFCLEPGFGRHPYPGIPAGEYTLGLRRIGRKNREYLELFGPSFHKGMIEIQDVPDRDAIELHIGNTISDTKGCSLCGTTALGPPGRGSGHWEVANSRAAYMKVYPIISSAILAGITRLSIVPVPDVRAGAGV